MTSILSVQSCQADTPPCPLPVQGYMLSIGTVSVPAMTCHTVDFGTCDTLDILLPHTKLNLVSMKKYKIQYRNFKRFVVVFILF